MTPLYRYLGSHAFETLDKERLKTSRVRDLNDPFELLYSPKRELTQDEARSKILNRLVNPSTQAEFSAYFPSDNSDQLREKLTHPNVIDAMIANYPKIVEHNLMEDRLNSADAKLRLICFSSEQTRPCDEILLWSHYANKHQGHRIEFEIPQSPTNVYTIDPVTYSDSRVEADYTGDDTDPIFLDAMVASIGTKHTVWEYESEFRLTVDPSMCIPDERIEKMEHFPFDRAWVRRVYCGLRSDPAEDAKIAAVVKERYAHARVYKAQFHSTDYSIDYALIHPEA